jgi:acetyl esterase/lipase
MNPTMKTLSASGAALNAEPFRPRHPPRACRGRPAVVVALWVAVASAAPWDSAAAALAQPTGPRPAPPGVQVVRDLEYVAGGHERNRLDLYLPEKAARPLPVILWVHGGGWTNGDKARGPAQDFATNGFAVAAINYRFSQHAIFPAQIQDCKAAIRWLRANAGKYGLDAAHIGAWGASAGGHLVALLGVTAGVMEFDAIGGNTDQSSRVQAVVDWFGPTDFLTAGTKDTRTNLIGGDPQANKEKAMKASPMSYVSKDAAPFLIMHGDKDKTVPISQSETFAKALQQAGADATFVVVTNGGHGGPLFNSPATLKQVEAFSRKHLTNP